MSSVVFLLRLDPTSASWVPQFAFSLSVLDSPFWPQYWPSFLRQRLRFTDYNLDLDLDLWLPVYDPCLCLWTPFLDFPSDNALLTPAHDGDVFASNSFRWLPPSPDWRLVTVFLFSWQFTEKFSSLIILISANWSRHWIQISTSSCFSNFLTILVVCHRARILKSNSCQWKAAGDMHPFKEYLSFYLFSIDCFWIMRRRPRCSWLNYVNLWQICLQTELSVP